jgi:hypothetical protein
MRPAARAAASVFVVWHLLVAVIAVAPDWPPVLALRRLARPYAALLLYEGRRNFFAPNPDPGRHVRYEIESAGGARHAFHLSEDWPRDDPAFLRVALFYRGILPSNPQRAAAVGRYLCRKHADLAPVAVTFTVRYQLALRPETYLAGHRPLDEPFVRARALPPIACAPPEQRS